MTPLIEARGLKKYFPVTAGIFRSVVGEVKAVDGVDFTIYQGQTVGLVGESGSGKSTIARLVIGLLEPTSGRVISSFSSNTAIQMVFQDPYASLNPRKSIGDTLTEPLLYHKRVNSHQEAKERAAAMLEKVGLTASILDRYPHQFSGGQQQRICIARALMLQPRLIVADEAVSALDVSIQAQILNLLHDLKSEMDLSYLFIAHDLSVVRHLCDYVIVLYLGKVMEAGPLKQVFSSPKHPYTQALLSATPKSHPDERGERQVLKGEMPSPMHPPSGCPFRTRCPYAQPQCAEPPPKKGDETHHYFCIL